MQVSAKRTSYAHSAVLTTCHSLPHGSDEWRTTTNTQLSVCLVRQQYHSLFSLHQPLQLVHSEFEYSPYCTTTADKLIKRNNSHVEHSTVDVARNHFSWQIILLARLNFVVGIFIEQKYFPAIYADVLLTPSLNMNMRWQDDVSQRNHESSSITLPVMITYV